MAGLRKNPAGIKCILYDIGQTLVICHNTLISWRLGRLAGRDKEEVRRLIAGTGGPVDQACDGEMNDEGYIKQLRKILRIDSTIDDALILESLKNSTDFSRLLRRMLHFLRDQAEGGIFVQGIVSNIFGIHWRDIVSRYPTLRLRDETSAGTMDLHMLSYQARVSKPNSGFYAAAFYMAHAAVERLQLGELKPHECLFFDDLPENVIAAERFGFVARLVGGKLVECWNPSMVALLEQRNKQIEDKEKKHLISWGGKDATESIERHLQELGIGLPPESYIPPCDKISMRITKPYDWTDRKKQDHAYSAI